MAEIGTGCLLNSMLRDHPFGTARQGKTFFPRLPKIEKENISTFSQYFMYPCFRNNMIVEAELWLIYLRICKNTKVIGFSWSQIRYCCFKSMTNQYFSVVSLTNVLVCLPDSYLVSRERLFVDWRRNISPRYSNGGGIYSVNL